MYVTLYRDLEFAEVASMEESLKGGGIPHKLGPGGSEILVPVEDVARARVVLAKDGHAVGGRPGLELFDKPSWGMTDFSQRVTYQRALEGELARTVAGIRGVQRAQVHLVIPTPGPLRRLDRPASASVVLTLVAGKTLADETIQGITYVVSNSVENLSSENVAVMDDTGQLLSVPAGGRSNTGMTSWQFEMQRTVEEQMVDKIHRLLEPVLGAGHIRAQVSAELSFDQVNSMVETIAPQEEGPSEEPEEATAETEARDVAPNSRKLERSIASQGKLLRLTAAILVDESLVGEGEASDSTLALADLETMARDAIGINEGRGDRLTVVAVPFEPTPTSEAGVASGKPKADVLKMVERLIRPVIGLVAILVLTVLGLRVLRMKPIAPVAPDAGRAAGGEPAERPALAAGGARPADQTNVEGSDATVQVLRGWLRES
jgi:flagellar M-ring protein FliF